MRYQMAAAAPIANTAGSPNMISAPTTVARMTARTNENMIVEPVESVAAWRSTRPRRMPFSVPRTPGRRGVEGET